jgi:hypothetical protein
MERKECWWMQVFVIIVSNELILNVQSNNSTWRENPQYHLTIKQKTSLQIVLAQPEVRSRVKKKYKFIGFYLLKTTGTFSSLNV